jgi:hypothetical protein
MANLRKMLNEKNENTAKIFTAIPIFKDKVKVIQLNSNTFKVLADFLSTINFFYAYDKYSPKSMRIWPDGDREKIMDLSDWFIYHENGSFEVLSNKEFISKYKIIG